MRWEYCAVVGMDREGVSSRELHPRWPVIWYFTSGGIRQQDIRGNEATEIARAIAMLGDEGWEMVGVGGGQAYGDTVYFKRPKP